MEETLCLEGAVLGSYLFLREGLGRSGEETPLAAGHWRWLQILQGDGGQ